MANGNSAAWVQHRPLYRAPLQLQAAVYCWIMDLEGGLRSEGGGGGWVMVGDARASIVTGRGQESKKGGQGVRDLVCSGATRRWCRW
jgi:hypothetical protein